TTITAGLLKVDANQDVGTFIVRATSTADTTKWAEATVEISNLPALLGTVSIVPTGDNRRVGVQLTASIAGGGFNGTGTASWVWLFDGDEVGTGTTFTPTVDEIGGDGLIARVRYSGNSSYREATATILHPLPAGEVKIEDVSTPPKVGDEIKAVYEPQVGTPLTAGYVNGLTPSYRWTLVGSTTVLSSTDTITIGPGHFEENLTVTVTFANTGDNVLTASTGTVADHDCACDDGEPSPTSCDNECEENQCTGANCDPCDFCELV
ncbi:MAG: hypothetical protein FWG77_09760, partial [Treponema sp.]|nr:hypothetical protein [Treponema sp.]